MSILTKPVLAILPHIPKPIMRRLAARYIAGEELSDAMVRLRALAQRGHPGILDVLGENVRDAAEARSVAANYIAACDVLAAERIDCYVSVKPTHVGLTMRPELCFELYSKIAAHAARHRIEMRVEMEDAPTTDGTLAVFERLRKQHANVGIVLQSRLFRTLEDIDRLAPGPLSVRMVKGIYLEPAAIAHTEPEPIRKAYVECVEKLARRRAKISLATHDEGLAERCLEVLRKHQYRHEEYEFQVLLGVREELWRRWREAGHSVRIYVPYGPEWKPYSIRRMRKNPQILGHVIRAAFTPARR
ncbi:MAG: proline dehydrogenase family protein [Planctomycetia bacterium]